MAKGRIIYFGEMSKCTEYFTTSTYQFSYKMGSNPADFIVAVAGSFVEASDKKIITGSELADYYSSNDVSQKLKDEIEAYISNEVKTPLKYNHDKISKLQNTSLKHQIKILINRAFLVASKEKGFIIVGFLRFILTTLFYSLVFIQQGNGTNPSVYENRLAIFFLTLQDYLYALQEIIPTVMKNRLLFYRERGSGSSSVLPYWISLWIVHLPILIFKCFLSCVIVYWIVGFRWNGQGQYFGYYFCFQLLFAVGALYLNLLLSAILQRLQLH